MKRIIHGFIALFCLVLALTVAFGLHVGVIDWRGTSPSGVQGYVVVSCLAVLIVLLLRWSVVSLLRAFRRAN